LRHDGGIDTSAMENTRFEVVRRELGARKVVEHVTKDVLRADLLNIAF